MAAVTNKLQNVCWGCVDLRTVLAPRVLKVEFERKVDLWVSLSARQIKSERVGIWRVGNETEKSTFLTNTTFKSSKNILYFFCKATLSQNDNDVKHVC